MSLEWGHCQEIALLSNSQQPLGPHTWTHQTHLCLLGKVLGRAMCRAHPLYCLPPTRAALRLTVSISAERQQPVSAREVTGPLTRGHHQAWTWGNPSERGLHSSCSCPGAMELAHQVHAMSSTEG